MYVIAFRQILRFAAFAVATTAAGAAAEDPKIKCWMNRDGVRECGNAIPPEYAQQEHEVKNAAGMTVEKRARAKTRAEVARERAERKIQERRAAEVEARMRKQAAADKVLLDTFGSEEDLVLARDGQIANMESQIKLTESHVAKLQKSLDQTISKAADFERRGQPIPTELNQNVDSLRAQIAENRTFVETKRVEQKTLHDKFASDIQRFRELRSAER